MTPPAGGPPPSPAGQSPAGQSSAEQPSAGPAEPAGLARPTDLSDLAARVLRRPGRLLWLWAVWMLLWGRLTPLAALGGVLVAVAILVAFPFRAIDPGRRFRPWPALRLLGVLLADLVPSAVAVAWRLFRDGPRTPSAIVAVPLSTRSEIVSTLTANAVSLAPGAFVLEIDHEAEVLYVYALAVQDAEAAERVRASVLDLECRVLAAFGADDDVAAAARTRDRDANRNANRNATGDANRDAIGGGDRDTRRNGERDPGRNGDGGRGPGHERDRHEQDRKE